MPASLEQRLDEIGRARASLAAESRRLQRIGFEDPMRRCHEERRYWDFLAAVHGMALPAEPRLGGGAILPSSGGRA
jgi:hypothetical protein